MGIFYDAICRSNDNIHLHRELNCIRNKNLSEEFMFMQKTTPFTRGHFREF